MNDRQTSIQDIKDSMKQFRDERGWGDEDLKDQAVSLMLESAEVLELFQWLSGKEVESKPELHEAIGEELTDVLWWIVGIADRLNIDLSEAYAKKLIKHAKKYSLDKFGKDIPDSNKTKHYYQMKAQTRGSHPLADNKK